jgi:hypothetical protein
LLEALRDTSGQGQGHRRTGKGTQTDRDRDTDGKEQGHRRRGTETQTDTDRDTDGQGHKWTGKGTQADTDRDTDIDNVNGQLKKIRALKALSFKQFYKIES